MHHRIRRYSIAGLLIWLPIVVTFIVIRFMVDLLDQSLNLLPHAYQPAQLIGFNIPGFGVVISLSVVFITGMLVTNFLGHLVVRMWEAILNKIPLVRTIHSAVKQVLSTIFSSSGQSFRRVLLVEYPKKGLWSIAFQTGTGTEEVNSHLESEALTLFVPTTPNPTSGFLIIARKEDVKELNMSVDDALKMVISIGVVKPDNA